MRIDLTPENIAEQKDTLTIEELADLISEYADYCVYCAELGNQY